MGPLNKEMLNGATGFYLSIQSYNTAFSFDAHSSRQMLSSSKGSSEKSQKNDERVGKHGTCEKVQGIQDI